MALFENDHLTDPARAVLRLDAADAYTTLVAERPHADARGPLDDMTKSGAVKSATDSGFDQCCQYALWLWHDFLDESHTLSQGIETPEGAWWHGIMHRREGDFPNAKYWFRRVGSHVLFPALAAQADDIIRNEPADKAIFSLTRSGWDPYAYVDLCEAAATGGHNERIAVALQQLEWRTLFDHCVRGARGR